MPIVVSSVSACPVCHRVELPAVERCPDCDGVPSRAGVVGGEPLPPVAYELAVDPGVVLVGLQGELDLAVAPVLRTALGAAADRAAHGLVVDLSPVTFADSTAIAALLGVRRRPAPQRMATVLPEGRARLAFDLTGVEGMLGVAGDRTAALRAVARSAG